MENKVLIYSTNSTLQNDVEVLAASTSAQHWKSNFRFVLLFV